MSTNVPSPTFGPTGFVVTPGPLILAGVQADINAAFLKTLNFNLNTPQGQLASSEAAVIANYQAIFVYYTQQVDPAYATGRFQDAIARINFLTRKPAAPTQVACTLFGAPGTIVPLGALAVAVDNNIYANDNDATIGPGGTVTATFSCQTFGPIACPAGTLSRIYQALPGWDSISNPNDGVLGQNQESRAAFELRRQESVAANSRGSLPAVRGAVLEVSGVLDCYVTENDTTGPLNIGGVTLVAKSLYVCALGGSDQDVADAIWSKKAPGCNYNGSTTVVVQDQNAGYTPPYPSYNVSFQRPAALDVLFAINIVSSPQVPSDAATQIQNAIVAAFAGTDTQPRAQIGALLLASTYLTTVQALGTWAQVRTIKMGSANIATAVVTASIASTTMNVTAVTSGSLSVGLVLEGTGIAAGTKVQAFITGAGGTGTYTVSLAQSAPAQTVTAVAVTADSVQVQINQAPTTAPPDIVVTVT